jgi:hypothetical protein
MIALDSPPTLERRPGDFKRDAREGVYVSDPTGDTVKSGKRKGEIKWVRYGRPSSLGKQAENTYNLQRWNERQLAYGMTLPDDLLESLLVALGETEPDSDAWGDAADAVIARAKALAGASDAADRGTHMHAVTDDVDQGRDWRNRAADGVALGLSIDLQAALVDCWQATMRDTIEAVAVEAACVDDTWRLAGTLDRLGRTLRPLRFVLDGGEVVDVPAGIVLVVDTKTGHPRRRKHAIQIASYAQSLPYDTETEQRGEWPWPIDQRHALVAHLDVNGALNGNPSCTLVYVDLIAGREHGGATVLAAKAWAKRDDMFSVAQLDATPLAGEEGVDFSRDATPDSSPGTPPTTAVEPSTLGAARRALA